MRVKGHTLVKIIPRFLTVVLEANAILKSPALAAGIHVSMASGVSCFTSMELPMIRVGLSMGVLQSD